MRRTVPDQAAGARYGGSPACPLDVAQDSELPSLVSWRAVPAIANLPRSMNLDGHTQKLRAALVRVNQLKESL